jgi:uncharacterized protein YegJ (DUF2314 family)
MAPLERLGSARMPKVGILSPDPDVLRSVGLGDSIKMHVV